VAGALTRTKSIDRLMREVAGTGEATLKRTLGPFTRVVIGFALAFGILIDAFVVRMTLIPALMSLLGERKTLERIQHTLKTGKPLRN